MHMGQEWHLLGEYHELSLNPDISVPYQKLHSLEDTIHICKHDKIIPCVKFQMRTEVWGCFQIKLFLKSNSHCPGSMYLSRAASRPRGQGLWHREQVTKAPPPLCRWQPLSWCFRGHRWNWGWMRKSVCKFPCTGKGENLAASVLGSEQTVLAPKELCQFTIS